MPDIATELVKEPWIISAVANEDKTVSNPDIIVTVDKGYVYQVFYDSLYGKIKIEYIGKVDPDVENPDDIPKALPTLIVDYQKYDAKIYAEAHHESGIAKIELVYKGEVVSVIENPTRAGYI